MATSLDPYRPDPVAQYAPRAGGPPRTTRGPRIIFVPWEFTSPESKEWKSKSTQWNTVKANKFTIIYYDPAVTADVALGLASNTADSSIYIRGHGSPGAQAIVTKVDDVDRLLPIEDACDRLIGMGLQTGFAGAIKFHFCYSGTVFPDPLFGSKEAKAQGHVSQVRGVLDQERQRLATAQAEIDKQEKRLESFITRPFGSSSKLAQAKTTKQQASLQVAGGEAFLRDKELKVPTRESLAARGARHMRSRGFTHCRYYGYLGPVESEYGAMDTSSTNPADWHKYVNLEALHDVPTALQQHLDSSGDARAQVRASVARVQIP